jgi:hypothetical protein
MPLLRTLPPFLLGRWRLGFEPGFDGGILREEVGHVRDEMLDDRKVVAVDRSRTVPFNLKILGPFLAAADSTLAGGIDDA